MKLVFFGTGPFGIPTLEALKKSSHRILSVVSSSDKPQGRQRELQSSPVKEWAVRHNIPVFDAVDLNSLSSLRHLQDFGAELWVVIDFGIILTRALLEIPNFALNVHSSLLPRHRGAAPVVWALLSGDTQTGVTVMRMTEKLDAGDILIQKKEPIFPDENVVSLEKKLQALGAEALLEGIEKLEKGNPVFLPQDESKASYARKLKKADGAIDWKRPASQIVNQVRALLEWPGSYCFYKGKRLIVLDVGAPPRGCPGRAQGPAPTADIMVSPGTILKASPKEGLWVAAADGVLEIRQLQAEGKNPLPAKEFLKGFPLAEGQVLE